MIVEYPKVVCLCPTMPSRQRWLPRIVQMFVEQDYPGVLELLIGVDGPVWIESPGDGADHRHVRILSNSTSLTLGRKRNWMIESSTSDLFIHWDDDDYHGPSRVRKQVEALDGGDLCLLYPWLLYFKGTKTTQATARTIGVDIPPGGLLRQAAQDIVVGGSALFTRRFWTMWPFPDVPVGSDRVHHGHEHARVDVGLDYVVIRHSSNNSQPPGGVGGYFYEEAPYVIEDVEDRLAGVQARCGVAIASM